MTTENYPVEFQLTLGLCDELANEAANVYKVRDGKKVINKSGIRRVRELLVAVSKSAKPARKALQDLKG